MLCHTCSGAGAGDPGRLHPAVRLQAQPVEGRGAREEVHQGGSAGGCRRLQEAKLCLTLLLPPADGAGPARGRRPAAGGSLACCTAYVNRAALIMILLCVNLILNGNYPAKMIQPYPQHWRQFTLYPGDPLSPPARPLQGVRLGEQQHRDAALQVPGGLLQAGGQPGAAALGNDLS